MTNNLMVEFCGAFGAQQPILKILCERNNSDDSSSFGQGGDDRGSSSKAGKKAGQYLIRGSKKCIQIPDKKGPRFETEGTALACKYWLAR